MSYTRMQVDVSNQVGHITLNQPDEYNRMPPVFWQELPRAIREMDASGSVRTLIVPSTDTHEEMLSAVRTIAEEIARKSPLAITRSKHLMNYGRNHSISDTLDYQQLWIGAVNQGGEMATTPVAARWKTTRSIPC